MGLWQTLKVWGVFKVLSPEYIINEKPDIIVLTMQQPWVAAKYLCDLKEAEGLTFKIHTLNELPTDTFEIPLVVMKAWREYNKIDPTTAPSSVVLVNTRYLEYNGEPETPFGYNELSSILHHRYSHLFIIRSLERGGAEKVALNYMKALNEINPEDKILVITTTDEESPWAYLLPPNAEIYHFGREFKLSLDKMTALLYCIVGVCDAKTLHIINSDIGYEMLAKYGHKIAQRKKIFDSQFCINFSHEGYYIDWPSRYLKNHEYLTGLFSENKSYLNIVNSLYNFPKKKYYCHYQPVEVLGDDFKLDGNYKAKYRIPGKINVLWASRICQQKRPDILFKIADVCKYNPMHFHVWGRISEAFDCSEFERQNITYHGSFSGWNFRSEDYDVFLYTSETDGMPNVVLEAMANGFPIITSNSGGVSEAIGSSWGVVEPIDNIFQYVTQLMSLQSNLSSPAVRFKLEKAYEKIKEQHTWKSFVDSVKAVKEYIG